MFSTNIVERSDMVICCRCEIQWMFPLWPLTVTQWHIMQHPVWTADHPLMIRAVLKLIWPQLWCGCAWCRISLLHLFMSRAYVSSAHPLVLDSVKSMLLSVFVVQHTPQHIIPIKLRWLFFLIWYIHILVYQRWVKLFLHTIFEVKYPGRITNPIKSLFLSISAFKQLWVLMPVKGPRNQYSLLKVHKCVIMCNVWYRSKDAYNQKNNENN